MTSPQPTQVSTGRGGAGNIGRDERPKSEVVDLATPTIKANLYTTGRGGTGNMARNDPAHPEIARLAQDVEAPVVQRENETAVHYGRGGAANIARVEEPTKEKKGLLERIGVKK
ncbi:hypothetical protein EJ06DRAFT_518504 [Trichodelitschia bisporula]|uniref:Uncharacterized protein n=1 Tax=Trichodelitschia bisporula TaxID=703511 RepID=A0A6G1IBS4_9PEZI|nr:hypothetical protein EJ06DRAFT_518504 [Trichodelitschia bisporula]